MEYFDSDALSGTLKKTVVVPENFAEKIISSSDYDSILGFGVKFNDYQRGNTDGDKLAVTIKSIKFNRKADAPADKAFDDGLADSQRGSVVDISYPTKDYTAGANASSYEKHAWVYLPAGYDAADTATKYPVFVLLHGFGQNENTWGLTNQGRGGKIKGYMDRGMASGDVEKFILVVANGVASASWGPYGPGNDFNGFNAFGGELRNDLLPYMRANFNVADGRENVAIAGLSMGGGQTFTIGIGECLDLASYFGAFSAALFGTSEDFIAGVEATFPDYNINQLYMICGDADGLVYGTFPGYVDALSKWSKIVKFDSEVYEGGTHDFPVWYRGFNHFIPMLFK
jgi:S-formylglutathione hydrolase FrmB